MKYSIEKFSKIVFLLCLLYCTSVNSINEIEIASSRVIFIIYKSQPWCWTKPMINDPSFILNPNNGGPNWGYCKKGEIASSKKKEYYVYISTSSLPKSGTE